MIILSFENIKLSFGVDVILENINFSINEGDKVGIVGVNGAGKTSLIKLITGEYKADTGNIYILKEKNIGILDQSVNFNNENTIYDEMLLSYQYLLDMESKLETLHLEIEKGNTEKAGSYANLLDKFTNEGGYEFRGRCKGILKNLGFGDEFLNLKILNLSGGQKTRLALARLLMNEPDILILDEPTNHLDINVLFWLESFLKTYKKTIIVISHDRYFLDNVTNKIYEVENKRGKMYNGNYSKFILQKSENREIREHQYNIQQREIERIEMMIEQQRRWGREKNIRRAESKQKMLDKMEKIERPEKLPDSIRMKFNKSGESGFEIINIKNLSKGYPNNILFNDFNALITKKEHVFIIGDNGCGKSTLIKILADKISPDKGKIEYGYNVAIGYYDQENQELDENNTVIDELWNKYSDLTQTEIRNALALFLFKGDDIEKPVKILSGGERARLTLTKLILSKMNLLILDEPTNHLDINSREALEKALINFDGTIIAVSHDRYFINKLATRILDFNAAEKFSIYDYKGSYSEYIEYKKEYLIKNEIPDEIKISESKEQYLNNKKNISEQRKYENKIKKTQDKICELENKISDVDEKFLNTDLNYTDYAELSELKEKYEAELLILYELLEYLTAIDNN